jgi:hypothetical protein
MARTKQSLSNRTKTGQPKKVTISPKMQGKLGLYSSKPPQTFVLQQKSTEQKSVVQSDYGRKVVAWAAAARTRAPPTTTKPKIHPAPHNISKDSSDSSSSSSSSNSNSNSNSSDDDSIASIKGDDKHSISSSGSEGNGDTDALYVECSKCGLYFFRESKYFACEEGDSSVCADCGAAKPCDSFEKEDDRLSYAGPRKIHFEDIGVTLVRPDVQKAENEGVEDRDDAASTPAPKPPRKPISEEEDDEDIELLDDDYSDLDESKFSLEKTIDAEQTWIDIVIDRKIEVLEHTRQVLKSFAVEQLTDIWHQHESRERCAEARHVAFWCKTYPKAFQVESFRFHNVWSLVIEAGFESATYPWNFTDLLSLSATCKGAGWLLRDEWWGKIEKDGKLTYDFQFPHQGALLDDLDCPRSQYVSKIQRDTLGIINTAAGGKRSLVTYAEMLAHDGAIRNHYFFASYCLKCRCVTERCSYVKVLTPVKKGPGGSKEYDHSSGKLVGLHSSFIVKLARCGFHEIKEREKNRKKWASKRKNMLEIKEEWPPVRWSSWSLGTMYPKFFQYNDYGKKLTFCDGLVAGHVQNVDVCVHRFKEPMEQQRTTGKPGGTLGWEKSSTSRLGGLLDKSELK